MRPRSMIFTFFGDYVSKRGEEIWVGSIIELLECFGLSEQAIRSALSRMCSTGWLKVRKVGNRSYYSLTSKSKKLYAEGGRRLLEPRDTRWQGKWYLLTYFIPEQKRHLRDRLRKELAWLGFGLLSNATWISCYDLRSEVASLVDSLQITDRVQLFEAQYAGFADGRALVAHCWDLAGINKMYAAFLSKYRPAYENLRLRLESGEPVEFRECFVQRVMVVHEYRKFPYIDPQLPRELLPDNWLGHEAASLFRDFHDLLADQAESFFNEVFEKGTPRSATTSGREKSSGAAGSKAQPLPSSSKRGRKRGSRSGSVKRGMGMGLTIDQLVGFSS
ncbi:MAG: phenylacetic acid degradation operon negative regulatory protein PaaX [Chloroflexota bacterium]|nr:MAG: phenylacetic acid degradation operon negative regulatory protein PaaX [Chloroflexota bacterium]